MCANGGSSTSPLYANLQRVAPFCHELLKRLPLWILLGGSRNGINIRNTLRTAWRWSRTTPTSGTTTSGVTGSKPSRGSVLVSEG